MSEATGAIVFSALQFAAERHVHHRRKDGSAGERSNGVIAAQQSGMTVM